MFCQIDPIEFQNMQSLLVMLSVLVVVVMVLVLLDK